MIRSGTQLTAEVLRDQPRLKVIVRAGVGVDNIDVPTATRQGIVVMNTPGGNTVSTAEHTMALMLALSRNVAQANDSLKAGTLGPQQVHRQRSSAARRWAIVGLGRVGLAVAKRAQGFDMKVVGFDPFLSAERAAELGIESVSPLDDLWGRCDYITLHTPLSAETRNLIGAAALARMKPGVRIINCARGGLIDEAALARGARRGQGRRRRDRRLRPRAARRRPSPGRPSPRSWSRPTLGPRPRRRRSRWPSRPRGCWPTSSSAGQVRFSVNMPTLDRAELDDLRLYLDLGRRLGMLHAQMDRGTVKSATLRYRGEVAHKNTRLITASFAAGWMEAALEDQVNLVNAEVLAKERGITIIEEKTTDARRLRHHDPDRGHRPSARPTSPRARSSASSSSGWSGSARTGSTPTSTATC